MKPGFVADCSVIASWFFEDEHNPYAEMVLDRLTRESAVVPILFYLEIGNVFLTAERKRRITRADSNRLVSFLLELPIVPDQENPGQRLKEWMDMGRSHSLTAYDAAYLELASRTGLPLATLDKRLRKAAASLGIAFFDRA